MFFAALPDARHAAMTVYLRQCVGLLQRQRAPGDGAPTVRPPSALRFLIAAVCGWLLWQPLKGEGDAHQAIAPPVCCSFTTTGQAVDGSFASPSPSLITIFREEPHEKGCQSDRANHHFRVGHYPSSAAPNGCPGIAPDCFPDPAPPTHRSTGFEPRPSHRTDPARTV